MYTNHIYTCVHIYSDRTDNRVHILKNNVSICLHKIEKKIDSESHHTGN